MTAFGCRNNEPSETQQGKSNDNLHTTYEPHRDDIQNTTCTTHHDTTPIRRLGVRSTAASESGALCFDDVPSSRICDHCMDACHRFFGIAFTQRVVIQLVTLSSHSVDEGSSFFFSSLCQQSIDVMGNNVVRALSL